MWKAGKKHGKGTYVFSDTGIKLTGEWTEGQIFKGLWVLPNGDRYEGEFENNMPNGKGICFLFIHFIFLGVWSCKNGGRIEGNYRQLPIDKEEVFLLILN